MAMASVQVADRVKASTLVQASAALFGDASEALAKLLGKGDIAKASRVVVEGLASDLAAKTNALAAADDKVASLSTNDAALYERRDDAAARSRLVTMDLRDAVTSGLRLPVSTLGVDGPTPVTPDDLLRFGQSIEKALADSDPAKRATKPVRGFTFDRDAWLEDIKVANKALGAALVAVTTDAKADQHASLDLQRAMAAYDAAFSACANVLVALFTAAGRKDLADRVRPSRRHPGRLATPDEDVDNDPTPPTT